jgi:hypothetical protein
MVVIISPRLSDELVEVPVSIITPSEDREMVFPLALSFIDRSGVGFEPKNRLHSCGQSCLLELEV